MASTGIRVRGMKYLNNFESEKILWNSSQEMNPKRYLFGRKGKERVSRIRKKGVIDLGLNINKKIIKERVGQDKKIADFVLHLQLRKCK